MIAELVELGLAIRESPIEVAHAIVEALEAAVTDEAKNDAHNAAVPLNEAIPAVRAKR